MAITSDRFIQGLKRRVTMPASQVLMRDSDILAMADYVMRSKMIPLIKSVRQNFFVTLTDTPIVSGQVEYNIPYRAIGRGLRDVKLKDSSNGKRDMILIALEDEHLFRAGTLPIGFYFRGDKLIVVPRPTDDTYTLELWWEMPPSQLITVSEAATVVSVAAPNVTVSAVPAAITTGSVIDFVQGISGNSILSFDQTITNIAGNTITFGAGVVPDNLAAGDYISLAQTAPVVQLPNEAICYLETCTGIQVLKALGDYDGAARLEEDEKSEAENLKIVLEPRTEGEETKIINRKGLVRGWRGRFLTSTYYY